MAGTIIADKIQTENSFLTLNVGQTLVATINSSGILNSSGGTMISANGAVSNTAITGLVTAAQIATVANTQITGNITSSQITSNPTFYGNVSVTGNTILGDATTDTLNVGAGGLVKDASGNVGIGTASPNGTLDVVGSNATAYTSTGASRTPAGYIARINNSNGAAGMCSLDFAVAGSTTSTGQHAYIAAITGGAYTPDIVFGQATGAATYAERMRIDSSGNLLVAKTAQNSANVGIELLSDGRGNFTVSDNEVLNIRRLASDGNLIRFYQNITEEGSISVSGTTVSYNGGHLSRWAQTTAPKDDTLVKGTVLSNLDEMNVYTDADGNPVDNEQLNKAKVSDVEGDANVAGVFVNWSHDDDHDVDEINMAMTGDMIIRIAQGTTVARGDLLMSAGDGTAKPQGDDIVRSKTVAKVTSTHVTCTYADGSFCVPCVLMAC